MYRSGTRLEQPSDRAKRTFFGFTFFNVISFSFIGNDIMTLYMIRLDASSVFIGMISAFFFMTFLFTIIGRQVVRRIGAVRTFGRFWTLRYLLMLPVVATAIPLIRSRGTLVFALIALGTLGFNVSKGIAIASHPPVVGEITGARDRGSFLSRNQLIIHLMRVLTGISMALLLGDEGAVGTYAMFILIGIGAGLVASRFVFRLPEPTSARRGFDTPMSENLKRAFSDKHFVRLAVAAALTVFVVSMATPFLVLFFKQIYGHTDSAVVFFAVAGSVGAAGMALLSGFFVDRVGPKPLLFVFAVVLILVLLLVTIHPGVGGGFIAFLVPAIIYFFFQMGLFGLQYGADTYFFSYSDPEHRLDTGIVFSVGKGIAGLAGGFLGGVYHSLLSSAFPDDASLVFQVFFLTVVGIVVLIGFLATRLPDTGSFSIQDAVGLLFSPRDLRAIRLLNRLDRSSTQHEEQKAVEALRSSGSALPVPDLLTRLASPSLFVRTEALQAIRSGHIDARAEAQLLKETATHEFTTAHLAAETIGERGLTAGIPVLREALGSHDYLLCSKAMVSLARLGDRESLERIKALVRDSSNPRVIIFGAKALEIFRDPGALSVLLDCLARAHIPFVREDLVVSIAGMFGMAEWFFPLYSSFMVRPDEGIEALDAYRNLTDSASPDGSLAPLCRNGETFAEAAPRLFEGLTLAIEEVDVSADIAAATARRDLAELPGFRFLIVALAVFFRLNKRHTKSQERERRTT